MNNNENIGISFVNIPIEVFSSKELTANEKILYGYLSIFKKQCCFQSNEALAAELGVSENTITNALKHLSDLKYIFIEFINGNSAKRRIYVVLDNPKKLKYLVDKGYLKSFPQDHKNCDGNKNCEVAHKNCDPQNRGEAHKNCDHRIIKENKNIERTLDLAIDEPIQSSNKPELENRILAKNKPVTKSFGGFLTRAELLAREYAV